MKKILIFCFAVFSIAFLAQMNQVKADCFTCDGYLDTGACNKTDINNKFCGVGVPANCYNTSGCPGIE